MAEHTGAFSKFMGLCDKVTGHDQEVLKLIKKRHQRAKADFIQSEGFIKLLQHTSESITKDTSNKYVHIKDLLTELKAYQDQPIKPSRISNLHGESHTDSSARKRMFDSDTDSIPDMKRYHIDVSTDLDENSKDSNISEPTIEGHRPVKKNHEGNCDSSTLAARHAHLDDIEELSARNGASVLSPNKQKLSVLVTDCVSSKRYKNAAAGDVETLETTVGNGGDGLGNGGNIVPYAGMAGEGALDIGDRCRSSEVADSSATKAKGSERHIIKLEELLKEISKRIKKLEEKDISLDEMEDDSAYTLVERYKSKFVKVWNKLCSIKGRAPTTGRTIERKFHFEGTRYPEVNKRIERFINRHKIFPDFHDIYEVVTRCNVKHCLRLGRKTINVIAREAFIDVGNQLQERRIRDFQGNFGCHLTESYRERNDPALYDKELHSKLNANKVQWKSSMDEVINKFVKQQEVGDDEEEEEEEVGEAASDGELLHDEQVGSRGTSGERDRDDADKEEVKEEKVAVDAEIDEKKDVEDSGVTKEEEEDLKGKDITTEGMEGDKEEVWEREDGSKGDEIEDRDLKDEVKTESGRRIKPKMGSQEEDELSRPLQAGCRDSVKVVSSHGALAAVDCVDSHTSDV